MRRPRFTPFDDRTLGRFRFQAMVIGLVWAALGGVRIATSDGTAIGSIITAAIVLIGLGFLVTTVLAFIEFRRRSADG
jgi:hypothetical protein